MRNKNSSLSEALPYLITFTLGLTHYRQEEIGQIIMLYGIGVVAVSGYMSKLVDQTGSTEGVLFWGAAISGLGLVLVGLMGSTAFGDGLLRPTSSSEASPSSGSRTGSSMRPW